MLSSDLREKIKAIEKITDDKRKIVEFLSTLAKEFDQLVAISVEFLDDKNVQKLNEPKGRLLSRINSVVSLTKAYEARLLFRDLTDMDLWVQFAEGARLEAVFE